MASYPPFAWETSLRTLFHFLVFQYRLLPSAWRFVCPVNAARPAARPLLPFQQLFTTARYPSRPGCRLFCILNPANKLVPSQRRQLFPQLENSRVGTYSCLNILRRFVNRAMPKIVGHEILRINVASPHTLCSFAICGEASSKKEIVTPLRLTPAAGSSRQSRRFRACRPTSGHDASTWEYWRQRRRLR